MAASWSTWYFSPPFSTRRKSMSSTGIPPPEAARKILKIFERDEIGGDCFRRLSGEKRVSELEQKFWQVLIRGYS